MEFTQSIALFLIPIAVFFVTEVIKLLNYNRKHGRDISYYSLLDGHMPSAHTAYVASLVITMWLFEGYRSPMFAVSLIMATIVITDALKLRAHVGHQAEYINRIILKLNLDEKEFSHLKERVGHKPKEVVVGAFLGILLTLLFAAFLI
jgi:acid phosphatase family membrane protein YuiD